MTSWSRWGRRAAIAVSVALLGVVGVLAVEVVIARRGLSLEGGPLVLDGRIGPATGTPLRVAWLGDSTAAGVGAEQASDALPTVVASGIGGPVELTVLAMSGDRVGDVLDEQLPAVAGLAVDVVFVSIGANDVTHLTTRDDFRDGYRKVLAGLPDGAEVVVLGVPDMGSAPRLAQPLRAVVGFRGRRFDEVAREAAREAGATYVPIARATGPAFRREPGRLFAADGYHPSAAGYRLWAEAVLAETGHLTG